MHGLIDPERYGVSFSLKQCRNFGLDPKETLRWLIDEAGFRRFRLMSYWDEHEKQPGEFSFSELDWQLDMITKAGGVVTLCLGARQPRWPENHWPAWAWKLSKEKRTSALLTYVDKVVRRYKRRTAIVSYQLENEALFAKFGTRSEVDRERLKQEFSLVKRLDPTRPVIMSTSNHIGIPVRAPTPDIIGFSYYRIVYDKKYRHALHFPWLHRIRRLLIALSKKRPVYIHELQLEPWGPTAIWKMSVKEQNKSMSPGHIRRNLALARKTKMRPIDLWGGEWWYWRIVAKNDRTIWNMVRDNLYD